jgi:hypothetical protein
MLFPASFKSLEPGRLTNSLMALKSSKKLALGLGVASVAASAGSVAVQAGPALQTLNNITNTAEFTINNTYGQSFSVDGILTSALTPFEDGAGFQANFNALSATLTTGFTDGDEGVTVNLPTVTKVEAEATIATLTASGAVILDASALEGVSLAGATGVQTLGASISSTLYGPSNVKASSSFTNQLINDLSAF